MEKLLKKIMRRTLGNSFFLLNLCNHCSCFSSVCNKCCTPSSGLTCTWKKTFLHHCCCSPEPCTWPTSNPNPLSSRLSPNLRFDHCSFLLFSCYVWYLRLRGRLLRVFFFFVETLDFLKTRLRKSCSEKNILFTQLHYASAQFTWIQVSLKTWCYCFLASYCFFKHHVLQAFVFLLHSGSKLAALLQAWHRYSVSKLSVWFPKTVH